jgi:hypothetical protein
VASGFVAAAITARPYFGVGFAALVLFAMIDIALTQPSRVGLAGRRAAGEAATAKAVKPLRYLGFTALHDRSLLPRTPGPDAAPIDVEHLLIGPAGVFLVDSKNWMSGPKTQFAEKGLWRGLDNRQDALDRIGAEAKALTTALGPGLPDGVAVQPMMVVHIKDLQPTPRYLKGILIVLPHQLDSVLRQMRQVLVPEQVTEITAMLEQLLVPRTGDRAAP